MRSGQYALLALLALPACYAPSISGGAPCDPAAASCPLGQTCQPAADGFACLVRDAGADPIDAGIDGTPPDGAFCIGDHLLGSVCLSREPTAAVVLSGTTPINSGTVAPGGCTEIVAQASGPSLCVISGTTITVPSGVTVRAFAVEPTASAAAGTNPVVLIATQTITITGTLDVASHAGEMIAGMPVLGAGARTAIGCAAIGLDGTQGRPANQVAHGNPVAGTAPTVLVGGCPGGSGGNGDTAGGGAGGGIGGGGGGAVYLLAGGSITISGKVNASGAGGGKGGPGEFSSGGGAGGGSGGLIGLEAPAIMIPTGGTLFANGGGGASGSGIDVTDMGTSGSDPANATTAASGGAGNDGGGAGGVGSVAVGVGAAGKNGSGQVEAGGGGGGGGAGVIRVFGVPASSVTGAISPPAT